MKQYQELKDFIINKTTISIGIHIMFYVWVTVMDANEGEKTILEQEVGLGQTRKH